MGVRERARVRARVRVWREFPASVGICYWCSAEYERLKNISCSLIMNRIVQSFGLNINSVSPDLKKPFLCGPVRIVHNRKMCKKKPRLHVNPDNKCMHRPIHFFLLAVKLPNSTQIQ